MFVLYKWEKVRRQEDVCGVTAPQVKPCYSLPTFPLSYTQVTEAGANFKISKV